MNPAFNRSEFVSALSDPDGFTISDLQSRFAVGLDADTIELLDRATSLDDRLFIALNQIPLNPLLRLGCEFASHVLNSARQYRKYDWQFSEGKRNESTLADVRNLVELLPTNPESLLRLQACVSYQPFPTPGIFLIAKAASEPPDAARHIFHMAKMCRKYFAWLTVGFGGTSENIRAAKTAELEWQIQQLNNFVADSRFWSV